jgi:hypothetical protein
MGEDSIKYEFSFFIRLRRGSQWIRRDLQRVLNICIWVNKSFNIVFLKSYYCNLLIALMDNVQVLYRWVFEQNELN